MDEPRRLRFRNAPLLTTILLAFVINFISAERQTYQTPPECDVNDPMSCSQQKHEVCMFLDGVYKCACPQGYGRLPDGRCLVINECKDPKLNECSKDAQCVDQAEGYTCRCNPGFADAAPKNARAGSVCKKQQNECSNPHTYGVDCDPNAACVDTTTGYDCRCHPGYTDISETFGQLPGRKCIQAVNECEHRDKNDCSENAICTDAKEGYTCTCNPGFVDASANVGKYPGRVCNKPNQQKPQFSESNDQCEPNRSNSCSAGKVCTNGHCVCAAGSVLVDGHCQVVAACQVDPECDRNANCINVLGSYTCQCKPGYFDVDPVTPGRECKELANECADRHDCSPNAKCVDNKDGYECTCNEGYTDVSHQFGQQPGRKCVNSSNECAERSLNTCDENADCIDTPQGYSCQCFAGYVDVSMNAYLPPGRVCTVQTSCPKQKTDLIFLIDGSGSIGSQVFRNEILRFIKEFIELFDIGLDNTRVGLIQYSDQIRHEFNLNQYTDKPSLLSAIDHVQYLTGLTRTGAAIQHLVSEGFSDRRGVRPLSEGANRVAVVITDGRSQDNVTQPAKSARALQINTFAIGVTDHVSATELELIAGSPNSWFYVEGFKDLDMRLRSLVQKLACPPLPHVPMNTVGGCNPDTQTGCDRALGQICVLVDGRATCQCPTDFAPPHPRTKVCGGDLCNPEVSTSCPHPEICRRTPLGNYRCVCPNTYLRDTTTGVCVSSRQRLPPAPPCPAGKYLNPRSGKCLAPGACDPSDANSCDLRKRERCMPAPRQQQVAPTVVGNSDETYKNRRKKESGEEPTYATRAPIQHSYVTSPDYTCQCTPGEKRHPVTGVCLRNECLRKEDNDCDRNAQCIDTDESYYCVCLPGFLDNSPDRVYKPGRVCSAQQNECQMGTHHCSPNAICYDTQEGYVCRCKPGYVDFSPNPQHESGLDCRPLVDECKTGKHTCSPNAFCYDTADSYKCICKPGFKDMDELRNPGRNCQRVEEQRNPCSNNNCHPNAQCMPIGPVKARKKKNSAEEPTYATHSPVQPHPIIAASHDVEYTCQCNAGYEDHSPAEQPGRICVLKQPICLDKTKMDCHPAAICQESSYEPEGFTCHCRDGYLDKSAEAGKKSGRVCPEKINECLRPDLNDCDKIATCKDLPEGYTCICPPNSIDQSPDKANKPGRKCLPLVNECANPALNNCSKFADCHDKEEGYYCVCRPGFRDDNPSQPGTQCTAMVDECKFENLNDCSKHAKCIDQPDGYTCECIPPYVEGGEDKNKPGRICLFNECENEKDNDCDKANAICVDLPEGYTCKCKEGFYDESFSAGKLPGRVCVAFSEPEEATHVPAEPVHANCTQCGNNCCFEEQLNEVCVGGSQCKCRPGMGRQKADDRCEPMEKIVLTFRVVSDGDRPLFFSSTEYGNSSKPAYVEFSQGFNKDLGKAVSSTAYTPRYILTDVNYMTHPKTLNSSWPDGLLVNFTVGLRPEEQPTDVCDFWNQLMESIQKTNGQIGGGKLKTASDIELLSTCPKAPGEVCRSDLGEFLIGGEVCGCPQGQKRAGPDDHCRVVESWTWPIWVIRKNQYTLDFNETFANPLDALYKQYVQSFEGGVRQSYLQTPLRNSFVTSEVIDLLNPNTINCTWEHGVIFNTTFYFRVGSVAKPQEAYNQFIRWVIDRNHYQIGQSGLYLNPQQPNPFSPCYKNDCFCKGLCIETGPSSYRCECPAGFRDMLAALPGHDCVSMTGINECENKTLNECSPNARCIDLEYLYRCECLPGFSDNSPKGAIPGSVCVTNYCSDVNYCSANATCFNLETGPECRCNPGYVDIRNVSEAVRVSIGLRPEQYCLLAVDVNECLLGWHDCASVAQCINLAVGYTCKCPADYTDQNPSHPGRVCVGTALGLVGDICNGHGYPVYNGTSNSTVCICEPGWEGEFCAIAASNIPLILFLILALLFLILALCCCLYLCSRLRCFRRRKAESEDSLYGQALTIPRAKLDEDLGSMASSEYTIREEIERRVTTEVTRMEEQLVDGEAVYEETVGDRHQAVQQSQAGEFYSSSGH